jgi:hypothetical protein
MIHVNVSQDRGAIMSSEVRRAENEFILQSRNDAVAEKVKDIAPGDTGKGVLLHFKCECSELNCGRDITFRIDDYQRITKKVGQFIVFPLHEQLDIEATVERYPEYNIVEKRIDLVEKAA